MASRNRRPKFQLVLEALPPPAVEGMPEPPPAELRLRRALKCLLRSFGLRCVSAERVGDDASQHAGASSAAGTTAPQKRESIP